MAFSMWDLTMDWPARPLNGKYSLDSPMCFRNVCGALMDRVLPIDIFPAVPPSKSEDASKLFTLLK